MRLASSGVYLAGYGRAVRMDAGCRLSALTHGDSAAGGTADFHELLRVALDSGDPVAAVPDTLAANALTGIPDGPTP